MAGPWQPPTYRDIYIRPGYQDFECDRCGSIVTDIIKHNRHHHSLDKLLAGVQALTRILAPDAPPGQLLEYLPDFPLKVQLLEGGRGGEGAGATGGQGSSLAFERVQVGRGGKGNNPDIPECSVCHAVGGGGHGGGCPNAGRPVSEWAR